MNIFKKSLFKYGSQLFLSTSLFVGMISSISTFQILYLNRLSQENQVWSSKELLQKEANKVAELKFLKRIPTLGFENAAADIGFIQFLQYFGDDELRQKTNYRLNFNFFDAVIAHDPYYKDFYFFLSSTTSVYAGNAELSVKLMNQGLAQMTEARAGNSYYVWHYKGIDELLFLGDSKVAEHSFHMAAEWANQANTSESLLISESSKQLAKALSKNPNSKQVRINAWSNVLAATFDDATREKAVREIRELGGDVIFSEDGGIKIKYSTEAGSAKQNIDS
jgi:hypothetical protein